MKKFLAILVLGLLWCSIGLAKELLIQCEGKQIIGESKGNTFTDNFLIDTSKKTWGNAVADKSKHDDIYIDDQWFLKVHYMGGDEAWVCSSDGCTAGYHEINRLTGEFTSLWLEIPRDELQKEWFDKKPIYESEKKFYMRAVEYLSKKSLNISQGTPKYVESYYKAKCTKSDKKF